MKSVRRLALVCMLLMGWCMASAVVVSADSLDKNVLYDGSALIDGDTAEDTVTILTRGNHLAQGRGQITNQGNRKVYVVGTTTCHKTCDKVICNLYLEQLSDNGNWYTYKYWTGYDTNVYTYSQSRTVSVAGGHWYRVRGSHSAILNGVTESVGSYTDGIWIG